jgi:hypothetical protein
MAALEDFVPDVSLDCMGVALPIMEHAIRLAVIDFCNISRAWKDTGSISIRANRAEYEVPTPDQAVLITVEEAYYSGTRIDPCAPDALRNRYVNWTTRKGIPEVFSQFNPVSLTLIPCPLVDLPKGLEFRACYTLDRAATTVPDWLFQQYGGDIAKGAVATLAGKQNLPCYSETLAAERKAEFMAAANQAKHRADKGFTRAPRRVAGHYL